MTEPWMPSDEEIEGAWDAAGADVYCTDVEPIRALIRAAVEEALAAPRPDTPLNQRLYDLVRYQRHELQDAGLITEQEMADLILSGSSSARRLEDYDRLHARHAREIEKARLEAKIEELDRLLAVHLHERFIYENHYPVRAVPQASITNRIASLRAALAALEVKP